MIASFELGLVGALRHGLNSTQREVEAMLCKKWPSPGPTIDYFTILQWFNWMPTKPPFNFYFFGGQMIGIFI